MSLLCVIKKVLLHQYNRMYQDGLDWLTLGGGFCSCSVLRKSLSTCHKSGHNGKQEGIVMNECSFMTLQLTDFLFLDGFFDASLVNFEKMIAVSIPLSSQELFGEPRIETFFVSSLELIAILADAVHVHLFGCLHPPTHRWARRWRHCLRLFADGPLRFAEYELVWIHRYGNPLPTIHEAIYLLPNNSDPRARISLDDLVGIIPWN